MRWLGTRVTDDTNVANIAKILKDKLAAEIELDAGINASHVIVEE